MDFNLNNKETRKRLAKSARALADDVINGQTPLKLTDWSWCGCAAHYVVTGAGFDNNGTNAYLLDQFSPLPMLLTVATEEQLLGADGALVFPLLALADALEASNG